MVITNSSELIYNEQTAAIIPEYSTVKFDVTIQQSENTYTGHLTASFYPNYGLVLRPLILTTATGDLYAHLEFADPILSDPLYNALIQTLEGNSSVPEELSVTVQTNPMVYLVWGGVALMLVGISIQFTGDLRPNGKR